MCLSASQHSCRCLLRWWFRCFGGADGGRAGSRYPRCRPAFPCLSVLCMPWLRPMSTFIPDCSCVEVGSALQWAMGTGIRLTKRLLVVVVAVLVSFFSFLLFVCVPCCFGGRLLLSPLVFVCDLGLTVLNTSTPTSEASLSPESTPRLTPLLELLLKLTRPASPSSCDALRGNGLESRE